MKMRIRWLSKPLVVLLLAAALGLPALWPATARAGLVNGNFEAPNLGSVMPNSVQVTSLPAYGWNAVIDPNAGFFDSSVGILRAFNYPAESPMPVGANNYNVGFIQLANERATWGDMWQTVALQLQPNTVYTVTFDVGNRNSGFHGSRDADSVFQAFFSLGAGSMTPAANSTMVEKTLASGALSSTLGVGWISSGTWMTGQTLTFDTAGMSAAQLNQPLNLIFSLDRAAMSGPAMMTEQFSEVNLDNVLFTTSFIPVPEPSSLVLLGASALGLLACRRKSWAKMLASRRAK